MTQLLDSSCRMFMLFDFNVPYLRVVVSLSIPWTNWLDTVFILVTTSAKDISDSIL